MVASRTRRIHKFEQSFRFSGKSSQGTDGIAKFRVTHTVSPKTDGVTHVTIERWSYGAMGFRSGIALTSSISWDCNLLLASSTMAKQLFSALLVNLYFVRLAQSSMTSPSDRQAQSHTSAPFSGSPILVSSIYDLCEWGSVTPWYLHLPLPYQLQQLRLVLPV